MFTNRTINKKIYFAVGVSVMFALLSIPALLLSDILKFLSNISLSYAAGLFAYGEWARANDVVIGKKTRLSFVAIGFVLVALCCYLLTTRYM